MLTLHRAPSQVHSAGVSSKETDIITGPPSKSVPLPRIIGQDVSGLVVAKGGRCVGNVNVGDHVFGVAGPGSSGGSAAQYCSIPERCLARKPPACLHSESAALLAGLPAFQTLKLAKVNPGDNVLMLGPMDMDVRVAKALGCHVTVALGLACPVSPTHDPSVCDCGFVPIVGLSCKWGC